MSVRNRIYVDPEFKDIILRYLENKRTECKIIVDNLKDGDIDNIKILGHRMKGSGKTLGLNKITEIGWALENSAEQNNRKQIERLCWQLTDYINNTVVI